MLLLYDSKCSLCKKLAYDIHFSSGQSIDIESLYSPGAQEVLAKVYPQGWAHDFYLIQNGSCKRGARALPSLMRAVGVKRMTSLCAEYGYIKLRPRTCDRGGADRMHPSKRHFLRYAAMAPLAYVFSKLAYAEPVAPNVESGTFLVHIAEVISEGAGRYTARAYECTDCARTAVKEKGVSAGSTVALLEKKELLALTSPQLKIQRVTYLKTAAASDGAHLSTNMTVCATMLDTALYNLSVSVGQGQTTSLVALGQHDLPLPAIDFVVYRGEGDDASSYFSAYAAGVAELARLHSRAGRSNLGRTYLEMNRGLTEMGTRYAESVTDVATPIRNELVLTSMPEALKFFGLPGRLVPKTGASDSSCDCSCSCGACCGCGCTLGICVTPDPCFCDCCIGCGCGCGCCLGGAS